jgi:hypothetical protein
MAWQCSAPIITCHMPPTANNWVIGCWGEVVGDGHWRSPNEFVEPKSLYDAQLKERMKNGIGSQPAKPSEPLPIDSAAIDRASNRAVEGVTYRSGLRLQAGRLTLEDRLLIGPRLRFPWWRGHTLPRRAEEFGPAITRFVPGRERSLFTDDLDELTDSMQAKGQVVAEHHWGLWYDRRRDDHQMIRRISADVWPPFYELPWARSGKGTAWDGLSKYDLERFNPWYFDRLRQFAELADRKGLVLLEHMYFQHNILEAGAHWADFPWRPANCLQATGFPEPPPYENRKRIDMSTEFYDVSHPVRRELHRAYIRQCLSVLSQSSNVIFTIGEEFTGPESFVRYWLETVRQWRADTGRKVLIALSCTRDVQDRILADPSTSREVDIIDLKYWWYTADGTAYAPPGDEHLSPRQQLRNWKGNKEKSASQVARQVREYRLKYPEKAVICSFDGADPLAIIAGGGSLAGMSSSNMPLLERLLDFEPVDRDPQNVNAKPPIVLKETFRDRHTADPTRERYFVVLDGPSLVFPVSSTQATCRVETLDAQTLQSMAVHQVALKDRQLLLESSVLSGRVFLVHCN